MTNNIGIVDDILRIQGILPLKKEYLDKFNIKI